MFTEEDYEIANTKDVQAARKKILAHIQLGDKEANRLIEFCAANIPRDSYVHPRAMELDLEPPRAPDYHNESPLLMAYLQKPKTFCKIHPHALGQLCDLIGLPRTWMNKLNVPSENRWKRSLLMHSLNTSFYNTTLLNARKKEAEFLHRKVGNELRAVLTQSYNRHLVSAVVLMPFLEVCAELGVKPVRAQITDMKVGLQCYLPFAFEPIPGEFLALGVWWGNSDFGQGKLRVSHTIMRLANGGSLLTEDSFSRVHLGSVVTDTDLRMDDQVAVKELEAVAAAIQSGVRAALEPAQVKKVLSAVTAAHEEKIPWSSLSHNLSRLLRKDELESIRLSMVDRIEDLPPPGVGSNGQPFVSKWWAAAALARLANSELDAVRSGELQQYAGQYLEDPEVQKS